jgi:O-antigen ligase
MYPDRPIASLRLTQWRYALTMIRDRPFGGWGLQSFSPLYESHSAFFVGHPHNLYLMLAAETGTIATLLLLLIVGGIVARATIGLVRDSAHGGVLPEARSLVFTYTIAFLATSGYNVLDISLFQDQINLLSWTLLASLAGRNTSRSPEI